jgi:hypothetical protein
MAQTDFYDFRSRVVKSWEEGNEEGLHKVLSDSPELMTKWLSEEPRMLSIALSVAATNVLGDAADAHGRSAFAKFLATEPALLARVMSMMAP